MNQPRSIVFAAVLTSLGIVGCGGSDQLKVGVADGDLETSVGELPKVTVPDEVTTTVPPAASQTVTPSPAITDAEPTAGNGSEPVGSDTQIEPSMAVQADDWWKPKASENLKWQWQLQGKIDTTLPVQVYNIDIEAPQVKIDELKARGIKLICYFSAGTVESFRSDSRLFPQEIIGEQYEDLPTKLIVVASVSG